MATAPRKRLTYTLEEFRVELARSGLHVSNWTLRDWLRLGKLRGFKVKSRWRILASELARLTRDLPKPAAPAAAEASPDKASDDPTTVCAETPSHGSPGGRLLLLEIAGELFIGLAGADSSAPDEDLVAIDDAGAIAFLELALEDGGKVNRLPARERVVTWYRERQRASEAAAREAREARRQRLRAPRSSWA